MVCSVCVIKGKKLCTVMGPGVNDLCPATAEITQHRQFACPPNLETDGRDLDLRPALVLALEIFGLTQVSLLNEICSW